MDYLNEAKEYIKEKYGYTDEKLDSLPISNLLMLVEVRRPDIYDRLKVALRKDGYII